MHRWEDTTKFVVEEITCGMQTVFVCIRIGSKVRLVMNL